MISATSFFVPTPPVPGQQPAPQQPPVAQVPTPPVPGQAPAPQAPAGVPAPPVAQYWAVNGASFHTLAEAGQAMQAGQTLPPAINGQVKAQKIVWADAATQQTRHSDAAKRFLKNSVITGILSSTVGMIFPPIAMVGGLISAWNGYKAFEEWQASKQPAQPAYIVAEEGRIKSAPTLQPLPYTYEAVNVDHFGNLVPEHPFFYSPPVPLSQV